MPDSSRFIWAICSSLSKSPTARRPFTIAVAPTSRATSTTRVDIDTTLTVGRWASDSATISSRASTEKSGSAFCGFLSTATTTESNNLVARSTTSRCPLWNGSKDAGEEGDRQSGSLSVASGVVRALVRAANVTSVPPYR